MSLTENGKKLMTLLEEIWDNDDFICGVMSNAKKEESRKELIEFINEGKEYGHIPSPDAVVALSVKLSKIE